MNEAMLQELGAVRDQIDALDAQMLALLNALYVTARGVGELALVSPLAWALTLSALGATALWVYVLRRLSLQGLRL